MSSTEVKTSPVSERKSKALEEYTAYIASVVRSALNLKVHDDGGYDDFVSGLTSKPDDWTETVVSNERVDIEATSSSRLTVTYKGTYPEVVARAYGTDFKSLTAIAENLASQISKDCVFGPADTVDDLMIARMVTSAMRGSHDDDDSLSTTALERKLTNNPEECTIQVNSSYPAQLVGPESKSGLVKVTLGKDDSVVAYVRRVRHVIEGPGVLTFHTDTSRLYLDGCLVLCQR